MEIRADDRTILRSLTDADAAPMFALIDANRKYLREWLPWLDFVREASDIGAFISGVTERARAGTSLELAIVHERELCGVSGFRVIDRTNRSAEIGYWLSAACQGRGTMSAAVRALLRHGFESLDLNRIAIQAATGNARSRAVPERLGFKLEGVSRQAEWLYDHFVDAAVYSLLRQEWRP